MIGFLEDKLNSFIKNAENGNKKPIIDIVSQDGTIFKIQSVAMKTPKRRINTIINTEVRFLFRIHK